MLTSDKLSVLMELCVSSSDLKMLLLSSLMEKKLWTGSCDRWSELER